MSSPQKAKKTYTVKAPDGSFVKFRGPDGLSDQIVKAKAMEYYTKSRPTIPVVAEVVPEPVVAPVDTKKLPSYREMPEYGVRAGALDVLAPNDQVAKMLLERNPDLKSRYDAEGNLVLIRPDGAEFNANPSTSFKDFTDFLTTSFVGGAAGPGRTVLRSAMKAAVPEIAIESGKSALGGEFETSNVALGALAGGAGHGLSKAFSGLRNKSKNDSYDSIYEEVKKLSGVPTEELMYRSVLGKGGPTPSLIELARRSEVDPDVLKIADNLGFDMAELLAIKNSDVLRQLSNAVSVPESQIRKTTEAVKTQFGDEFKRTLEGADAVLNASGSVDMSRVGNDVLEQIDSTRKSLSGKASFFYGMLDKAVPKELIISSPMTNTSELLDTIKSEIKGASTPEAVSIVEKFIQKVLPEAEPSLNGVSDFERGLIKELQGGVSVETPEASFGGLEKTRRDIGKLAGEGDPYAKRIYEKLLDDQREIVKNVGNEEFLQYFDNARELTKRSIDLGDRLRELGVPESMDVNLSSFVSKARSAFDKASKGDVGQLNSLLKSAGEPFEKVIISNAFGDAVVDSSGNINYAKLNKVIDGIKSNQMSYERFVGALGRNGKKFISQLGAVSKNIEALDNSTKSGQKKQGFLRYSKESEMSPTKSIVETLLRTGAWVAGSKTVGNLGGGTLASATVGSVLKAVDVPAIEAAGDVMVSKEFTSLLRAASKSEFKGEGIPDPILKAARDLANSKKFRNFTKAMKIPNTPSDNLRFLNGLIAASLNSDVDITDFLPKSEEE